jgi:hypothetical protein
MEGDVTYRRGVFHYINSCFLLLKIMMWLEWAARAARVDPMVSLRAE